MGKRIKIPFNVTLASTKGIKNLYVRFPNFNRKEKKSQMKEKFKTMVKEITPAVDMIAETLEKSGIEPKYTTITFKNNGGIEINSSYTLGMEARRSNAGEPFFLETKEIID